MFSSRGRSGPYRPTTGIPCRRARSVGLHGAGRAASGIAEGYAAAGLRSGSLGAPRGVTIDDGLAGIESGSWEAVVWNCIIVHGPDLGTSFVCRLELPQKAVVFSMSILKCRVDSAHRDAKTKPSELPATNVFNFSEYSDPDQGGQDVVNKAICPLPQPATESGVIDARRTFK
jgi:hypothetical protein